MIEDTDFQVDKKKEEFKSIEEADPESATDNTEPDSLMDAAQYWMDGHADNFKFTGDSIQITVEKPTGFKEVAEEIGSLVEEKNKAYGNSFAKCGEFLQLLYPDGIKPDQYQDALTLIRIFDKQMRIATRKDAFGESPYRDIAGYGILGAAKDDGYVTPKVEKDEE
jgi:hypothetical protein